MRVLHGNSKQSSLVEHRTQSDTVALYYSLPANYIGVYIFQVHQ